jgi:hypothetical protein
MESAMTSERPTATASRKGLERGVPEATASACAPVRKRVSRSL